MTSRRRIPIRHVNGPQAIPPDDARWILGYGAKSDSAWKTAWWQFRKIHDIKPVPGTRSYPLRPIERAIEGAMEG